MRALYRRLTRLAMPAVALLALCNAGCLLAVAGVAGAGAVGYAYANGLLYRDYPANLSDTNAAVKDALRDMQFPVIEQNMETGGAFLKTRTANGHSVRIHLDIVPSPIPVEGTLTRVGVRVGFAGDEEISRRILDHVNRHLATAPHGNGRPTPSVIDLGKPQPIAEQQPGLLKPIAFEETAAPPLAGPPLGPPVPIAPSRPAKR